MADHTHRPDDAHIYDNGCVICDLQCSILAHANGTAEYPPWVETEEEKERACVEDIRALRDWFATHSSLL